MRQYEATPSGIRLIVVVVCIIFLALPGVACADPDNVTPGAGVTTGIAPNITSIPPTLVPTSPWPR